MSKNKLIALIIFFITAIGPFNYGLLIEMKPNMYTLVMFILSLVGIGLGAFFWSKKEEVA